MALNTQLQGIVRPLRPGRNPSPWHCVQVLLASAIVSDRVHSIVDVLKWPPESSGEVSQNLASSVPILEKGSTAATSAPTRAARLPKIKSV